MQSRTFLSFWYQANYSRLMAGAFRNKLLKAKPKPMVVSPASIKAGPTKLSSRPVLGTEKVADVIGSVGVGVGSVGVVVGLGSGVLVSVSVGVTVVEVGVNVGVLVGVTPVEVGVNVGVLVGVLVGVFVAVLVGEGCCWQT